MLEQKVIKQGIYLKSFFLQRRKDKNKEFKKESSEQNRISLNFEEENMLDPSQKKFKKGKKIKGQERWQEAILKKNLIAEKENEIEFKIKIKD